MATGWSLPIYGFLQTLIFWWNATLIPAHDDLYWHYCIDPETIKSYIDPNVRGHLDMGILMDKADENTVGSLLGEKYRFQWHYFHVDDERLTNGPKDRVWSNTLGFNLQAFAMNLENCPVSQYWPTGCALPIIRIVKIIALRLKQLQSCSCYLLFSASSSAQPKTAVPVMLVFLTSGAWVTILSSVL